MVGVNEAATLARKGAGHARTRSKCVRGSLPSKLCARAGARATCARFRERPGGVTAEGFKDAIEARTDNGTPRTQREQRTPRGHVCFSAGGSETKSEHPEDSRKCDGKFLEICAGEQVFPQEGMERLQMKSGSGIGKSSGREVAAQATLRFLCLDSGKYSSPEAPVSLLQPTRRYDTKHPLVRGIKSICV